MSKATLVAIIVVLLLVIVGVLTFHPHGCDNGHAASFGIGTASVCIGAQVK